MLAKELLGLDTAGSTVSMEKTNRITFVHGLSPPRVAIKRLARACAVCNCARYDQGKPSGLESVEHSSVGTGVVEEPRNPVSRSATFDGRSLRSRFTGPTHPRSSRQLSAEEVAVNALSLVPSRELCNHVSPVALSREPTPAAPCRVAPALSDGERPDYNVYAVSWYCILPISISTFFTIDLPRRSIQIIPIRPRKA